MLNALAPAHRLAVEALLEPRTYPAGTLLMREGDPGDGCCFIDEGAVRVGGSEEQGAFSREGLAAPPVKLLFCSG